MRSLRSLAAIGLSPRRGGSRTRRRLLGVVPARRATLRPFVPVPIIVRARCRWSGSSSAHLARARRRGAALPRHVLARRADTTCGPRSLLRDRGGRPDAAGVLRRPRHLRRDRAPVAASTQETIHHHARIKLAKYDELYGYAWWAFTRVIGYVLLPFAALEALLPQGQPARHGPAHARLPRARVDLRPLPRGRPARDARSCRAQPGLRHATTRSTSSRSRSWFDFLVWEAMYFAQFFALEMFFRGFWLGRAAAAASARAPSSRWPCPTA